jgi:hypothetical protein
MNYVGPLEEIERLIRREYPDATDDQINEAIGRVSAEINSLIIDEMEKSTPSYIRELKLPSNPKNRLNYNRGFRTKIRAFKEQEAQSKRKIVDEIKLWQDFNAEMGEVEKSRNCADQIDKIMQASSTTQNALSYIEIDLTTDIEVDESSKRKTMKMLRSLCNDSTED